MKPDKIRLREANIGDLSLLRHWAEKPHVLESDPNDDWQWETELLHTPDWRKQLIAELNGQPIGFVQIIDPAREETHYWGQVPENLRAIDIWIGEESYLNRGYGTDIMKQAISLCFSDPEVTGILIDPLESNTRAHRFYERLGFRFIEYRQFGADYCKVYLLERKNWSN